MPLSEGWGLGPKSRRVSSRTSGVSLRAPREFPLRSPKQDLGMGRGTHPWRFSGHWVLLPSFGPGPAHLGLARTAFRCRRLSGSPSPPSGILVEAPGDQSNTLVGQPGPSAPRLSALPGPLRPPFLSPPRSLGPTGAGPAFGKSPPPGEAHADFLRSEEGALYRRKSWEGRTWGTYSR